MKPGDIIFNEDPIFGRHTFYEIEAVALGAEGQESVVKVRSLSLRPASFGEHELRSMFIPEPLVRGKVFTRAEKEGK